MSRLSCRSISTCPSISTHHSRSTMRCYSTLSHPKPNPFPALKPKYTYNEIETMNHLATARWNFTFTVAPPKPEHPKTHIENVDLHTPAVDPMTSHLQDVTKRSTARPTESSEPANPQPANPQPANPQPAATDEHYHTQVAVTSGFTVAGFCVGGPLGAMFGYLVGNMISGKK
jgi:hypothetical protein